MPEHSVSAGASPCGSTRTLFSVISYQLSAVSTFAKSLCLRYSFCDTRTVDECCQLSVYLVYPITIQHLNNSLITSHPSRLTIKQSLKKRVPTPLYMPKHLVSAISLTLWVYKNPLFGYQLSVVSCQQYQLSVYLVCPITVQHLNNSILTSHPSRFHN
jgi:hypothetical protein